MPGPSKLLNMVALQGICRESKGTSGVTAVQLVRALESAGLSEDDAATQAADFFRDFDQLSTGSLPIKLFLDSYKTSMTLTLVNDILSNSTGVVEINQEQLGKLLSEKIEGEASAAQTRQMFNNLDEDKSGSISEAELRAWKANAEETIEQARNSFNNDVLLDLFSKFDLDGSGTLDPTEVRYMIAQLGEVLTNEEFDNVMSIIDADGSGDVDLKEFKGWFLNPDRKIGGASGAVAAGLRARLLVSRGQNWLSNVVAKSNSKGGLTGSLNFAEFKDTRSIISVSFEEKHLSSSLQQFTEDNDRVLLYVSLDWKVHGEASADFIEALLQPVLEYPNFARNPAKFPLKLQISRPSPNILRLSLGIKSRALDQLPIEQIHAVLSGASFQVEGAYDIDWIAENFHTMTLGDLIKVRARVHVGDVPSEMLAPIQSQEAKAAHADICSKLNIERIPVVSDLIEGQTGDLAGEFNGILTTLINEMLPPLYDQIKDDLGRHHKSSGAKPSNAERVTIRSSSGKYLNSNWRFQDEEAFVFTSDTSAKGASLFSNQNKRDSASGSTAEGGVEYKLIHKSTGKYPAYTGSNPWHPAAQPQTVFAHPEGGVSGSNNSKYITLKREGTELFASRGGRHWELSDTPYYFRVDYKDNSPCISTTVGQQYMRHYNGDHDNYTQNYMDRDTKFEIIEHGEGKVSLKNASNDRWLGTSNII